MPRLRSRALIALLALIASGCRPARPVTRDECDRLLDRYAEMLARTDLPVPSATEIQRRRDEVRARAASHRAFQSCTAEVSREQMDCALAAYNPDEIERCLVPIP